MKKVFSLLAVLALVGMVSSTVLAAASATKKAYANFDAVTLSVDVTLYEWTKDKEWADYTPKASGDIDFDISGITPGQAAAKYANATTFAKVSANLTAMPGGTEIYMYTKNASDSYSGDYKALAKDGDGKYGGLIRKGATSTYSPGDHATMRVAFSKISDFEEGGNHHDYVSALPDFATGGISGDNRFYTTGFRDLNDKDDTGFASLPTQEKILGTSGVGGGLWVGMSEQYVQWYSGEEDVLVFFGAKFDHVVGGSQYGTETITFGAITE